MPPPDFLSTAVELIKLGAIGFAGVVFISVFFILMRGKSVDKETARLRQSYLKYGTFCAVAFALLAFFQTFLSASHKVSLTFSPNFDVNLLPEPRITLLGTTVRPSQPFDVDRDMQVVVDVDAALKRARELAENVAALRSATTELLNQNEVVNAKFAAAIAPGPKPAELVELSRAIQETAPERVELKAALQANRPGDVDRIVKSIGRVFRPF